jgi:hypothetical protein
MRTDDIDLNQAVFTTKNVMNNKVTIVKVTHDHDGSWQFFDAVSTNSFENAMLVSLKNILDTDSSIREVLYIDEGHRAEREDKNKPWTISSFEEENENDEK